MLIVESMLMLQKESRQWQLDNQRIALIPTKGHIHHGHAAAIEAAKNAGDKVVVTMIIPPRMLLDNSEVPRSDFQKDYEQLNKFGVDMVFAPELTDLYPNGLVSHTYVTEPTLPAVKKGEAQLYCTIMCMLFNTIKPQLVYFSEKRYPKYVMIKKMVQDLAYDIDVLPVPITRNSEGIAYSRSYTRLSPKARYTAELLPKTMGEMADLIKVRQMSLPSIVDKGINQLKNAGFDVESIRLLDANTLFPATENTKHIVMLASVALEGIVFSDTQQIIRNE